MFNAEELKQKGNDAFAAKDYASAEMFYQEAILKSNPELRHILFTNLSTAQFHLGQYENSLASAELAIECNRGWIKGYYRKGLIYQRDKKYEECYNTYVAAKHNCEMTPFLSLQLKDATKNYMTVFRITEVKSSSDLIGNNTYLFIYQ